MKPCARSAQGVHCSIVWRSQAHARTIQVWLRNTAQECSRQVCCAIKAALLLQTLLLAVSCSLQLLLLRNPIGDPSRYSTATCDHIRRDLQWIDWLVICKLHNLYYAMLCVLPSVCPSTVLIMQGLQLHCGVFFFISAGMSGKITFAVT